MENLINSIITLDNDEKYIVINQAIYQGKSYFFVAKVTDDEQDVLDEFSLLEAIDVNGEKALQLVKNEQTIEILTKYFTPKE